MDNAVFQHNRKKLQKKIDKAEQKLDIIKRDVRGNEPSNKPTHLGLMGKKPAVKIGKIDPDKPRQPKGAEAMTEKQKYEKMWTVDNYRKVAPGELAANTFFSVAKPEAGEEITDFGAGTGRGGLMLMFMGQLNVTMLDFASNCLDADLVTATEKFPEKIRFREHDLMDPIEGTTRYGYCTDVMEHIPEDDVDRVLENILNAAQSVFFRISTVPDVMGPQYLKTHLHLTVKDYSWWAKKFIEHDCTILHSEDLEGAVDFYVTGWSSKLPENIKINTSEEIILSNIRANAKWPCKHVRAHMIQGDVEIQVLCGGPSLNDFEAEIIQNWKDGMKTVTMNGTYNWAQERGITNVNQLMIDARPFNKRFCMPPREDCYYFIASQCDPAVFEMLPHDRTFFWHCTSSPEAIDVVNECYPEYLIAGGGSTVMLRGLVLLRILGFKKMHIYGMDSCCAGGHHHAYPQPENDYKVKNIPVTVGDQTFDCQPWMAYQANEFIEMIKTIGDEFMLDVKGDGLIAHILKTGAEMPEIEET